MNSPYDDLGADAFGLVFTGERLRPHWHHEASCAGHPNPEIFYPHPTADHSPAQEVCRQCPVSSFCLTDALVQREINGVWGGMTPAERHKLKNARSRSRRYTG